ncbi:unnamed protein product [Sphenostylis stenocarpa]|uniref:Plasma membrane-associated cation-binding protein 1 n=1 Tax=Sphenostylis stenocarpa TaxID=92480 RepID=A0AA86T8K4_9FABA|nr:unnamed protein product [Sphenostylis stenocarpa]
MGYWKSKVLPKIKKVFEKNSTKKAAAEASKSFDEAKEEYNKAFEEKKTELQTKVVEIYEASSTDIKSLVKERNEAGLKKNSTEVHKFLEELVKIDFPGSKAASEASSKFGPALASGSVLFVFEKVSTFVVTEEKEEKGEVPPTETKTEEETSSTVVQEREIVVEEEKKEDAKAKVIETSDEKKVEEQPAAPAAKEEEKPAEKEEPPKP